MGRARGVLVALLLAAPLGAVAAAPEYVGVGKCKPCHLPEFGTWSGSAHAAALDSARAADGFGPACLACHATNASDSLPGVQCEACHGPGSQYWPIAVMVDVKKSVALGLAVQEQKVCDRCHDGQDHHATVAFGEFKHDHREKKGAIELE